MEKTNAGCKLFGTEYCDILNMNVCTDCSFGAINDEDELKEIKADLDTLMDMIPKEGIAPLFLSPTCLLCKKDDKNKAEGYALADIGNPEPRRTRRNFLGMKTKCRIGSLVPVQIACCKECKRNYFLIDYIGMAIAIIVAIVTLALLSMRSVYEPMTRISEIFPFLLFVAMVGIGILAGMLVKRALKKKLGQKTQFDIWEIPLMGKLKELGWEPISEDKKHASRLVFSKKRIARGVYTADNAVGKAE